MFVAQPYCIHEGDGSGRRVLALYTGGTLGMAQRAGSLVPIEGEVFTTAIRPQIEAYMRTALDGIHVDILPSAVLLDSAQVGSGEWMGIARAIEAYYGSYDGFVVLHGTDTLSYTAAALGYLLRGLRKPVVLTGAQAIFFAPYSDVVHNFCHAIEVATASVDGRSLVQEVCVFFGSKLLRGTRAVKVSAVDWGAFDSPSEAPLGELSPMGIRYNTAALRSGGGDLVVEGGFDDRVEVVYLHPGLRADRLAHLEDSNLGGVVLVAYGLGNVPSSGWFMDIIRRLVDRGVGILSVSACLRGMSCHASYDGSLGLRAAGVIIGGDITIEAATVKMMFALHSQGHGGSLHGLLGEIICEESSKAAD